MFILILILILILPGAFLPMALKSLFSSEDLIEMGVYLEESQTLPPCSEDPLNYSQSSFFAPLCCLIFTNGKHLETHWKNYEQSKSLSQS